MGDTEKLETIRYQYFMILTISALYRFIFDMTQLNLNLNLFSQLTLMLLITCYYTYLLKKKHINICWCQSISSCRYYFASSTK